MPVTESALLERPLYGMKITLATRSKSMTERLSLLVFDLPEELLYTLTLKSENGNTPQQQLSQEKLQSKRIEGPTFEDGFPPKATSCNLCGLNFVNLQEQRNHVKSDLHNYNLKQRIRGLQTVSELEFERLIGGE
jgi:hypothetical protein